MLSRETDKELVQCRLRESVAVKEKLLSDESLIAEIVGLADVLVQTLHSGGKVLICGNGGSASDALHMASELVGRFQMERRGYTAIALNSDVAAMTAIANDYGYEQVFSRQVEALLKTGDVLLGISTSGNSGNIVRAFEKARGMGGRTALLSGRDGGKLRELADCRIIVPSDNTARIQESHVCIYHILCELVETKLKELVG